MSRYEANPNNNLKSQPKAIPLSAHGKATTPDKETIVDRPNHVIINVNGEIGTPMSDLIEICFLSLSNNKNMVNK